MGKIANAFKIAGSPIDSVPTGDEQTETAGKQKSVDIVEYKDTPHSLIDRVIKDDQESIDEKMIVFHQPDSLPAENFKILRSQIIYPSDGKPKRTILVTSALEQEGKTFVACNLAMSIAQGLDPYCLLIDADLRRPAVHKMVGISYDKQGLADFLTSGGTLGKYLVKTGMTKLTVLPAGHIPRNPAELLTSSNMKSLLKEAKMRYEDRFIVIDSPPVNLASETRDLALSVDGVIFVIRYGKTSIEAVQEAIEKIGRHRILGIVFNGFEITPKKYSYYKKDYSYSSR